MVPHRLEQGGGIIARADHFPVCGMKEPIADGASEEAEQVIEIAFRIEQRDGLAVEAELRPGESLEQLIERAEASGQGEEGIGEFAHEGLAVVHGFDDVLAGEARVGDLLVYERLRDDADDLAARFERGIGERAHEADAGAAVDEAQPAAGDFRACAAGGFEERIAGAGAGAAEDTDGAHPAIERRTEAGRAGGL